MKKRARWLTSTRAALTKKRLATTNVIACLLVGAVCALCVMAALLIQPEPPPGTAEIGGNFDSRPLRQPRSAAQWFPKTPVDEATWRQLRDPKQSPSLRTKQLASGSLRVSTSEFSGVLASARRDELDVRAGYRPPQRRSLLCGEVVCAPVFASAQ